MAKRQFIVLSVVLALALCGCGMASSSTSEQSSVIEPDPKVESFEQPLATALAQRLGEYGVSAYGTCFDAWFSAYVHSRIIPVTPEEREPQEFGPWSALADYGATDAREDGSLTEWADNYYITHEWSTYGAQILSFIPGDVVTVNGATVRIEGIFNYPKSSYYDEIVEATSQGVTVFQTCYPNSDQNRIAWATRM